VACEGGRGRKKVEERPTVAGAVDHATGVVLPGFFFSTG
jgi:hypothetical protein